MKFRLFVIVTMLLAWNGVAEWEKDKGGLRGLPTTEEINEFFRTNSYGTLYAPGLFHVLTNLKYGAAHYSFEDVDRIRHCIMTNAVTMPHKIGLGRDRYGAGAQRDILGWVYGFPFVTNDINAINYLADHIGSVQPPDASIAKFNADFALAVAEDARNGIVTNRVFFRDKRGGLFSRLDGGPCLEALRERYKQDVKDSHYFDRCRRNLLKPDDFPRAVRGFMSHLPESERPAFRSNIVERARLTPEEQVKVFGK